jgi:hypothetical protein
MTPKSCEESMETENAGNKNSILSADVHLAFEHLTVTANVEQRNRAMKLVCLLLFCIKLNHIDST